MTSVFFQQFLMISNYLTVLFLLVLFGLFFFIWRLQRRKVSFTKRVLIGTGLGLILGLAIQLTAGLPEQTMEIAFIAETSKWYGLFGNGFIDLIRMLVIPLIMVSIVHVIMKLEGDNIGRMAGTTLVITMRRVIIASVVGLSLGLAFNLGSGIQAADTTSVI